MPGFDGTGPRGEGMFTGRGEGYCALRLPEVGSGEQAVGYAGIAGRPVKLAPSPKQPLASAAAEVQAGLINKPWGQGRRCRIDRRRCESPRAAAR
jgi:Family of unknown function (DUF5320)